jgi:hypothetical protein
MIPGIIALATSAGRPVLDMVHLEAILLALILIFLIDHGFRYLRERFDLLRGRWYRWPYTILLALGILAYCAHLWSLAAATA